MLARNLLGRVQYRLYFSAHKGRYIRLAVARGLDQTFRTTRWRIARLSRFSRQRVDHVASPEIHQIGRRQYLLTHSPLKGRSTQVTFCGRIWFGRFVLHSRRLRFPSYSRFFDYRGASYAIAKNAQMFRIDSNFVKRSRIKADLNQALKPSGADETLEIRHPFVLEIDGELLCFFTRVGDLPERILASRIIGLEVGEPRFTPAIEVLRPEYPFEGSELALEPSARGEAKDKRNELRDPYIFRENGQTYLLYSVMGESGIALGQLDEKLLIRRLLD